MNLQETIQRIKEVMGFTNKLDGGGINIEK